jgi:outer membrane receptor protein involved in Fe transport
MMKRSVAIWLTGACAVAVASGAEAQASSAVQTNNAQSAQQDQQGAGSGTQTDQEAIVITAEKRPQLLIDVPQSVSVVSGKTLEAQHANSFQDYLKLVPGLQLDQGRPGEGRLILRGVNTGGVASTVGVYIDETPFGSSSGLVNGAVLAGDFDTFDLNRIEVLRGPQGTLYGASSLSGVLRFVTNEPNTAGFDVRARVGVEGLSDGDVGYSGNAVVNVPLVSTVALRVSGSYRKDAGFIDSVGTGGSDHAKNINDDRVYGGRGSLLFRPSDAVSLRLSAVLQNIDANAPTIIEADPVTLKPLHGLSQSEFVPQFSNLHYRLYDATGVFDLGFANLTSSTSYATQKQHERIDFSNALTPAFGVPIIEPQDTNLKKFTQELRLASQSHLLDWLVGAYYTHEDGLIAQELLGVEPFTATPIPGFSLVTATVDSSYKELAGFADATIHLAPKLDLDLGGRYSHNKQSVLQVTSGPLGGGALPETRSSENVFTYSIAPKLKPNDNMSVYVRVAKGFRPGGPNVVPPGAPTAVQTYHSDSIVSYELGVKAQSDDHRFSIDAAAFRIDWSDIQLFANVLGFGVNTNGSSAKSEGVEFTATARPLRGLNLSLNGAYTNARLTDDTDLDLVGGRDGDPLPFTPKFSFALNGDYHWQLSSNATAHAGASYRHLSGQSGDYDPAFVKAFGRQRHVNPYGVFDLFAGVNFGQFDLEAYVKNVGNSHGITSTTATRVFGAFPIYPGGAIGTGIIRPRTFGLTVGFDY